jgi:hypothetical protein
MWQKRGVYRVLVRKPEGKGHLGDPDVDGRIILRWFFSGFGGLEDTCWPLVPKFAGSNPADVVGFFRAKESPARLPSEEK